MNTTVFANDDLQRKLELYQIHSRNILELKNTKSALDKILVTQENPDKKKVEEASLSSKKIKQANSIINEIKNDIADLIGNSPNLFLNLQMLSDKIAPTFAMEINTMITKHRELNQKLKSALVREITNLYKLDHENIVLEEKTEGKQDGFVIKDKSTGLKLFAKTSKIFGADTKSIDPRELFAYKVLEYMELGPETRFIIPAGSSSPSGAKICHIVTRDVGYSDSEDITKIFFTDNFMTKEAPHIDTLAHWKKSLSDKEFRIKFLTLSIINDLLHLNDTFATNAWNYGSILQQSKTAEPQYIASLVDHEVKNSLFEYEPQKNPIISLIEKLKTNANKKNITGELVSYKIIKDNKFFVDPEQIKSELLRAISAVNEKFSKAVDAAADEIRNLMSQFKQSFSKEADSKLQEYLLQTAQNIKVFSKVQVEYRRSNIDEISKGVIRLLNDDLQCKGEDLNTKNGLYLKDIEYNLQIIKNEHKVDRIFDEVVTVDYLCASLKQNQYLYVINPEGLNSKFNDHFFNFRNSKVIMFNANVQKDNSSCSDHALLLLKTILTNNSNEFDFCKLGVALLSNKHGNHAYFFIISSNPDLRNIIESTIASYKTSLGLNDIDHSISSTANLDLSYGICLDDNPAILSGLAEDIQESY